MQEPVSLHSVFQRRWAVPILAQLAGTGGCKFITLANGLEGSRASLKASLSLLDTLGFVVPNPGYGHPMRPEYILTARGQSVSKPAAALVSALSRADSLDLGFKKWSMPTLYAVDSGAERFSFITQALRPATDRAVSLALTDLHSVSMIQRTLVDDRPPRNEYSLTRRAKNFAPILEDMNQAMCVSAC